MSAARKREPPTEADAPDSLTPEPVAEADANLTADGDVVRRRLEVLATQLIEELGILTDHTRAKIEEIAGRELPGPARDAVVAVLNQALTPSHLTAVLGAAAAGLITFAKTGKSVVSHVDSDLA